jgi:tRNA-specific 2-thiouridylase
VSGVSPTKSDPRGVLVGAVAAMLLRDQGYQVTGVTLALWSDPESRDERTGAPLQNLTKGEVRTAATRAGLSSRDEAESQEICFIPDDDHRRFLRERLGEQPGNIVDDRGRVLAGHLGTYNYTIGQRKGLGIAGALPMYVVDIRADTREVVVGTSVELGMGAVRLGEVVHHRPLTGRDVTVQLRSSGASLPAEVVDGKTIVLLEPATGIAPGQTAVVYEGDEVILAGTVVSTERWAGLAAKGP